MTKEEAKILAQIIIDNLEGGYYHPDMKPYLKKGYRMGNSGETMYGLDRVKGNIENTQAGRDFYTLVDKYYTAHHADPNYYNDKADGTHADIPASVGVILKDLAAEVILTRFNTYAAKLDPAAKEIVFNDPALLIQFFYAVYNGAGRFEKFVNVINAAYSQGTQNAKTLYNLLQKERRSWGDSDTANELFNEGADKLNNIIKKYYGLEYETFKPAEKTDKKNNWIWWLLGGTALWLIFKNKK